MTQVRLRLTDTSKITRVLERGDVAGLITAAERAAQRRSPSGSRGIAIRDLAVIRLFAATGIRVGELVELTVDRVDGRQSALIVMGKGRRERILPLTHRLDRASIGDYLRVRNSFQPRVSAIFLDRSGRAMTTDSVRRVVRRLAADAGINGAVTPHMLRHTAATRLMEHGADIRVVQVLLGHRSIRTTERYTHVATDYLRRVVGRCHPLRRAA